MSKKHHPHPEPPHAEPATPLAEPASTANGSEELQSLREELDQVKDHALRCAAELENYRKRASRELADERRYANLGLLRDLLPVLDNIRRAIEAAEKASDSTSLLQGVQMVGRQLEAVFDRFQCERIAALHQPFDPGLHEAVGQQPSAEFPANTIILELLPGYKLHDRVVRAAQVIVSSGTAASNNPEGK